MNAKLILLYILSAALISASSSTLLIQDPLPQGSKYEIEQIGKTSIMLGETLEKQKTGLTELYPIFLSATGDRREELRKKVFIKRGFIQTLTENLYESKKTAELLKLQLDFPIKEYKIKSNKSG